MAQLDEATIKNLVLLSRIDCSPEEQQALLKDLQGIFTFFDQLDEVDTSDVTPCNHVLEDMHNVLREDVIGETLPREVFLANAPSHTGGMIRVPPVLKSSQ